MPDALACQKKASDSLELELHVVVPHRVDVLCISIFTTLLESFPAPEAAWGIVAGQ